ncbi:hypothetical protein HQ576_07980 [bacterium]|nr:hypothetical protein [bacterium]
MTRAVLIFVACACATAAELPRADDPTHFTPADRLAMMQLVRRTAEAGKAAPFDEAALPAKLQRSTGRPVVVSAHRPGRAPVMSVQKQGTLFEQLQRGALELAKTLKSDDPKAWRLKIDLAERVTPYGHDLASLFVRQPVLGIHGLWLQAKGADLLLLPDDALRLDAKNTDAFVRHAIQAATARGMPPSQLSLGTFTTVSFIERSAGGGGPPVDLFRGMPPAPAITRQRLLAAVEAAGDYLLRMQRRDGSFHYVYRAATDTFGQGYNIVRHAGTLWAMAEVYRATRHKRFLDGARLALGWLLTHVKNRGDAAWIEHDGSRPLGAVALAVVALTELRHATGAKAHDPIRGTILLRSLGRHLVAMQQPDGSFASHYDPETRRGFVPKGYLPLYVPGQACLALARLCAPRRGEALPDDAWKNAALKAADYLATKRDDSNAARGLEYVHPDAWTIMAVDVLHALGIARHLSPRRGHIDYAFFLATRILAEQETPATARWPDHVGAPRDTPPRSTPTASRCEGLVAAWRLARRMGAGVEPYRRAALLSAGFQLAHQYDAVNSYLLPAPDRARGGFYSSYADHSIRIDTVQHNLSSLLGLAELLAHPEGHAEPPGKPATNTRQ